MTTIYRVQDAEGRGPYRPGTSHLWTDDDHDRNPPFFIEFGWPIASIPFKWLRDENGGCGFRDLDQLSEWFSPNERRKLAARHFLIVRMDADRIIAESSRQLVFGRSKPLWADFIVVPWPARLLTSALSKTVRG